MSTLKSIIFEILPDPEEYYETAEALRDLDRQLSDAVTRYQRRNDRSFNWMKKAPAFSCQSLERIRLCWALFIRIFRSRFTAEHGTGQRYVIENDDNFILQFGF